eukprot:4618105-Ditylum_brightwellii.AAC.1
MSSFEYKKKCVTKTTSTPKDDDPDNVPHKIRCPVVGCKQPHTMSWGFLKNIEMVEVKTRGQHGYY